MSANERWRRTLPPVALAVAVFALVVAVTLLTRAADSYVIVWPVNALVLAVALNCPRVQRPWLLAGAFVGNSLAVAAVGNSLPMALLMALTNLVEVGVMLLVLGRSGAVRLMRRSGMPRFGLAVDTAAAVSAAGGADAGRDPVRHRRGRAGRAAGCHHCGHGDDP